MGETESQSAPAATPAQNSAPDPLARLYHMSQTAGAGVGDYVQINPTSIAAVLLGLASVLVILSDILLVVPAAGIVCAIIALVQVRRSNQTQSGTGLALMGLLLSLLAGGGRIGFQTVGSLRTRADEQQIAALLGKLGSDLAAGQYDQAYQLFDERFRLRVSQSAFETAFRNLNSVEFRGPIRSIQWNGQRMIFESKPDSDVMTGGAMGLLYYTKSEQPGRLVFEFEKSDGVWKINDIPVMFPPPRKKSTP